MKALVISTAPPDATTENQTGSTNWTLRLLRLLSHNHEITLLAPPPLTDPFLKKSNFPQIECQPDDHSGKCTRFIKSLMWNIYPSMWHQRSSKIDQFLSQSIRASFDVCWLLDDYAGMYLREIPKSLPVVFCRHFVLNMGLPNKPSDGKLFSALKLAWHRRIANAFDKWTTKRSNITITGTRESRDNLLSLAPNSKIIYFPTKPCYMPKPVPEKVVEFPNRYDGRITVVFVGDMTFSRNIEGVEWFINEVLPLLSDDILKQLHFSFVGRQPRQEIMSSQSHSAASLKFEGFVDDLETKLHQCQAAIIPIFGGNGVRIKTVTLLGAGLPIVTTTDGIEGLPVSHEAEAIIANTPEDFAKGLKELLDVEKRKQIRAKCRLSMSDYLSEENDAKVLQKISRETFRRHTTL